MSVRGPRERVLEAVTRGMQLVANLEVAKEVVQQAKHAEDALRLADHSKEVIAAAEEQRHQRQLAAEAEYWAKLAEIRAPLDLAQAQFDRAAEGLQHIRDTALAQAQEAAQAVIREAQREQANQAAAARAEVHTAQQQVKDLEAGLDRYARQVEKELGINLRELLKVAGESA